MIFVNKYFFITFQSFRLFAAEMPPVFSTLAKTQDASAFCAACGLGLGAGGCKCPRSTRCRKPSRAAQDAQEASQVAAGVSKARKLGKVGKPVHNSAGATDAGADPAIMAAIAGLPGFEDSADMAAIAGLPGFEDPADMAAIAGFEDPADMAAIAELECALGLQGQESGAAGYQSFVDLASQLMTPATFYTTPGDRSAIRDIAAELQQFYEPPGLYHPETHTLPAMPFLTVDELSQFLESQAKGWSQ